MIEQPHLLILNNHFITFFKSNVTDQIGRIKLIKKRSIDRKQTKTKTKTNYFFK